MRAIQLQTHGEPKQSVNLENAPDPRREERDALAQLEKGSGPQQLAYVEDAPDARQEEGDAIVRVFACAIDPGELRWASSYETRGGQRRLSAIPGHEIAGVLDRIPDEASTALAVGDEVYALGDLWRDGGAAEYMAIRVDQLAPKPKRLSFVEAAAVPLAALTAWQGLVDRAHLSKGQRVLVLGAARDTTMACGAEIYALQLAHALGAYVIAAAAGDRDLLQSLGADEVIERAAFKNTAAFQNTIGEVDVVFDNTGGDMEESLRLLRRGGVLLTTEGGVDPETADKYGVTALQFVAEPSRDALVEIARLINAGSVRPLIEKVFPFEQASAAFEMALNGRGRGKVVLEVVPQRLSR